MLSCFFQREVKWFWHLLMVWISKYFFIGWFSGEIWVTQYFGSSEGECCVVFYFVCWGMDKFLATSLVSSGSDRSILVCLLHHLCGDGHATFKVKKLEYFNGTCTVRANLGCQLLCLQWTKTRLLCTPRRNYLNQIVWNRKTHPESGPHFLVSAHIKWYRRRKLCFLSLLSLTLSGKLSCCVAGAGIQFSFFRALP